MFKLIFPNDKLKFMYLILSVSLVLLSSLGYITPVYADGPPGFPHQFFGLVTNNGSLVGTGYTVTAKIGTIQAASGLTDSQGKYQVFVYCQSGQTIDFYVNGTKATQTASGNPGAITRLDLTVTSAPATNTSTTTINTSILSQTDSFVLTNGVLTTAKDIASADGRVKLSFAVNTAISMQGTQIGAATESAPAAATDNSTVVRAYSFSPSGATFSPAVTMTLKYDTPLPSGMSEANLYIAYWTGSTWQNLVSSVNPTTKEVSASVSHFTVFAIRHNNAPASSTTSTPTSTTTTTTTTTTTPTTSSTTTVTSNVLGSTGSFSISGGTVSAATSLSSADGKVSIALAASTAVNLQSSQQLTVMQLATPPSPPTNAKLVEAYDFSPSNATFNPALSLTIKYNQASLPADVNESGLYIALLEGSTWTEMPSNVNPQNKTVTAQVSHFSTYALLGRTSTATPTTTSTGGTFSLSDFAVSPPVAAPGDAVTASIRVVNSGAIEATRSVVLKVNNKAESQKDITLAPGKSQVVNFTITKSEPGSYTISIDSNSSSFEIKAKTATSDAASGFSMPILIIIIAGGLLVIILVLVLIFRQRSSRY